MTEIHGHADPRFAGVRDAFAANFARGEDVGASVAVTLGGEMVVDLWGGHADAAKTAAVAARHHRQRLFDDQDDDGAVRAAARRPRRTRFFAEGRALLAGICRQRQGGGDRGAADGAQCRPVGLCRAGGIGRSLRLGQGDRACWRRRRRSGRRAPPSAIMPSPRAISSAKSSAASPARAWAAVLQGRNRRSAGCRFPHRPGGERG